MITLSNGHKFEYMVASGALGFFGEGWPWDKPFIWTGQLNPALFTVVAKTITFKPKRGNLRWYWPFGCIRFLEGGTLNAVGLTNPGSDWWSEKIRQGRGKGISLVASFFSDSERASVELALMATAIKTLPDIKAIEINASCPNTLAGVQKDARTIIESCNKVKKNCPLPIILKLSVVHAENLAYILPNIVDIVEAISINSVPWKVIFPNKRSPLERFGGGAVSGKIAQPYTWKFMQRLIDSTNIPVIAPSIWEYEDIAKVRAMGAKAVSFGSLFLRYPWRPTKFVKRDMAAG